MPRQAHKCLPARNYSGLAAQGLAPQPPAAQGFAPQVAAAQGLAEQSAAPQLAAAQPAAAQPAAWQPAATHPAPAQRFADRSAMAEHDLALQVPCAQALVASVMPPTTASRLVSFTFFMGFPPLNTGASRRLPFSPHTMSEIEV